MVSYAMPRPARWAGIEVSDPDPQPRMQRSEHDAPYGAESVAAPGRFANPFEPGCTTPQARLGGLVQFGVWLAGQPDLLADVRALGGRDLSCTCGLADPACHRNVLLDVANPPASPFAAYGRAMALTLRRPWASLLLVPESLGGKTIENRTWSTDYRGPVLVYGGTRIDNIGIGAARRADMDADWHASQQGWLGAAVLVDVHRARNRCCQPWGQRQIRPDAALYHWVFAHPHRLAQRSWGRGFVGLRPTSWSVLVRRSLLTSTRLTRGEPPW
jgi:hypothetical protein